MTRRHGKVAVAFAGVLSASYCRQRTYFVSWSNVEAPRERANSGFAVFREHFSPILRALNLLLLLGDLLLWIWPRRRLVNEIEASIALCLIREALPSSGHFQQMEFRRLYP